MHAPRSLVRISIIAVVTLLCLSFHSHPLQGETTAGADRLQLATNWINAVVATKPVADLRSLNPDERDALIKDIRAWLTNAEPKAKPAPITEKQVFPDREVLWARVPQIKADVAQASKWVYGVPYGAPKGATSNFYPNPDTYLFTGTATFNFAQAFLSTSDRENLCNAVTSQGSSPAQRCGWSFLLGSRPRDVGERLLSAVTLISTTAQNPRFSQGLVPQPGTVSYQKTFSETVTGSFDPTKIFRTGTDFKNAADALSKHNYQNDIRGSDKAVSRLIGCAQETDDDKVSSCIHSLAYGYGKRKQAMEILVPTIQVKAVTASDLAKSGANTFIQPPTQIPAQYEFSATWDLRTFVPNAGVRTDVVSAMQSIQRAAANSSSENPPVSSQTDAQTQKWKAQVSWYCIQLVSHPELAENESWWTRFENSILSSN